MLVNQELLPQYHTSISMQILDVPFAWVLVDVVFWITNGAVMQMKSRLLVKEVSLMVCL